MNTPAVQHRHVSVRALDRPVDWQPRPRWGLLGGLVFSLAVWALLGVVVLGAWQT